MLLTHTFFFFTSGITYCKVAYYPSIRLKVLNLPIDSQPPGPDMNPESFKSQSKTANYWTATFDEMNCSNET
jgi:hypothetical protein